MTLRLNGSTSGSVSLDAPATGSAVTLELPTDSIKPGLVLITAQSFTTAATVSVNNCFTSTYDNYRIVAEATSSISSSYFNFRFRVAGADNSTSNYGWNIGYVQSTTVASLGRGAATTSASLGWMTDEMGGLSVDVTSPQLAKRKTIHGTSMTRRLAATAILPTILLTGAQFDATTQFDGFTIYPDSGTFTGALYVYGYRKAV